VGKCDILLMDGNPRVVFHQLFSGIKVVLVWINCWMFWTIVDWTVSLMSSWVFRWIWLIVFAILIILLLGGFGAIGCLNGQRVLFLIKGSGMGVIFHLK
jgi:hypothetical protein